MVPPLLMDSVPAFYRPFFTKQRESEGLQVVGHEICLTIVSFRELETILCFCWHLGNKNAQSDVAGS